MTGPESSGESWDVLSLSGTYGLDGREQLEEMVISIVDHGNGEVGTVIDLTDLPRMNSVVLSWLLRVKIELESEGRQLRLAGPAEQHMSVLGLGGLDEAFPVYPDVDSALEGPPSEE